MTASRFRTIALSLFLLAVLVAVLVPVLGAQDVLTQQLRWTGPTTARTYTLPDANGQLVMTATATAWKVAVGSITLDGTNPSSATTGLATIIACTVSDERSTAPGDELAMFTTVTTGTAGQLDVYAWMNTSGTDPTLVASTDSNDVVKYVCFGS